MSILKTNLTLFENLSDWKYKENFTTVTSEFGELDIHFVDENSTSDECVLLLHGNPTWGYLYRNMIDPLKENGYCLLYTSPSPRDSIASRMPSSA